MVLDSNLKITPDTLDEMKLEDSNRLTHIKDWFYRGVSGHLYMRTIATVEKAGVDTLVDKEYFNGYIPQEIDPLSFEQLDDGWYAKDQNSVYVFRPTSGGMRTIRIDSADVKSFKVIEGHYLYGVDGKHVFREGIIVEGLNPKNLQIIRNEKGDLIELRSDTFSVDTKI
jgi:hypothetical protein